METIFIWYGHAAFGLTIGDDRILIDPFLTGNPTATVKAAELDADYILITHGHGDHIGDTPRSPGAPKPCASATLRYLAERQGGHARPTYRRWLPFGHPKLTPVCTAPLPDKLRR